MTSLLRRTLLTTGLAAGLSVCAANLQAAGLYKVEMIVFANLNADDGGEFWPELPPPETGSATPLSSWDGYPAQRFEQLPSNNLRLGGDAAALSRSPNYTLLYHKAWIQPIGRPSSTPKALIEAEFDDYKLEGVLTLHRQRFLHAQPHLQLTSYRQQPVRLQQPAQPEGNANDMAPSEPGVARMIDAAPAANTWQLNQSRRMKSNETHYIDHPKFGVLLRIQPGG